MVEILAAMVVALLVTIAVETGTGFIVGLRGADIRVIIWLNVVTNPLLNYLLIISNYFDLTEHIEIIVAGLEVAVVIIEWIGLVYVLGLNKWKMLGLSLLANATSFLAGWLLFYRWDFVSHLWYRVLQ